MGIFKSIMDKIFHHSSTYAVATPVLPSTQQQTQPSAAPNARVSTQPLQPSAVPGTSVSTQPLQEVDVDVVLTKLASAKGGGGNWRTSIVDLLKLLDLDSSLAARKNLAEELSVRAGADGSAEQNIALSKAVMKKLAENGGKVPESLKD